MKTSAPTYKQKVIYSAKQLNEYYIFLQLYRIAKAATINKKMPGLPFNDSRRHVDKTTISHQKHNRWKHHLTDQLHALTAPLFKRTVV